MTFFRNINLAQVVSLTTMADYRKERIISHSILNQPSISMVIFAMDIDEEISEEVEPELGWIRLMEGKMQATLSGKDFILEAGEDILIKPDETHSLKALTQCKYLQISLGGDSNMQKGDYIKKIPVGQVIGLADLIEYEPNKISSISLAQKKDLTISLFSLDQGEEMGGHASTGDAMVQVLEGSAEITIADETYTVEAGESIVMPANIQHSLKADKAFKMLLTVVKP